MRGRLNTFQVGMLRWRALHPYNAVHVVLVPAALDDARVCEAIDAQRTAYGLTGLSLDFARARYEYGGAGTPSAVARIDGGNDARAALRAEIERQLNTAFPADGAMDPMRFFVLPDGAGFHLGIAYDHFIAGGDAISRLLQDIVLRYLGRPATVPPPALYPPTFSRLLRHRAGDFLRGTKALPKLVASCRRGVRPRYRDDADHRNGFVEVALSDVESRALIARTKEWNTTFNDVVMAGGMLTLAPFYPKRAAARRRRELGIASIVNLRPELGDDVRDAFGQFLTSMRLSHPVPDGVSLRELAQDLHRVASRTKAERQYLQTLLAMRYNGVIWSFLDTSRRQRFYSKTYPVVAGVTTLNVDALWKAHGDAPSGYVRAVPTGPLAPLVIAATTAGGIVRLGVSYRQSAFTPEDAARITRSLADLLSSTP